VGYLDLPGGFNGKVRRIQRSRVERFFLSVHGTAAVLLHGLRSLCGNWKSGMSAA